jgi:hypothetical protein
VALFTGREKVDLLMTHRFSKDKVLVVSNGVMARTRFEFFFSGEAVWWPVIRAHGTTTSHVEAEEKMEGKWGRRTAIWEEKGRGVWLASEAHVRAELEATAWSVTLTRMHQS